MSGFTQVGKGARIEDSNIAMLGSKLEKEVKLQAAKSEKAWEGAGQKEGVQVWRIEKFEVESWPARQYGSFYDGDSYIVLHSYKQPGQKKMNYNIHFWLGTESSQDEQGTAAYKTVELDDFLGQVPVQFREVQGHESEAFKRLFPSTKILHGGVESGFTHVKAKAYQARLLRVKGEMAGAVYITQLPLQLSSLDPDDVYLLDAGLTLFQWNGPGANPSEKIKCRKIVEGFREERVLGADGQWRFEIVEGEEDNKEFWTYFGLKEAPKQLKPGKQALQDKPHVHKLFKVSDASGSLNFTLVKQGEVSLCDLDVNDAFVLDIDFQVYVWIGRNASPAEKRNGMMFAIAYLKELKRPLSTPIVRVLEGHETQAFKECIGESEFYGERQYDKTHKTGHARRLSSGMPLKTGQLAGVLEVTILSAKELRNTEMLSKQNPFCVCKVGDQKLRTTAHVDGGAEAKFDQTLKFELTGKEEVVLFQARTDRVLIGACIGTTAPVSLKSIQGAGIDKKWLPLLHGDKPAGQVQVSLKLHAPKAIRVIRAKDLPDPRLIGLGAMDPYVTLTAGHGESLFSPSGLLHATGGFLADPLHLKTKQAVSRPMALVNYRTPTLNNGGISPGFKDGNVFDFNLALLPDGKEQETEPEMCVVSVWNDSLLPGMNKLLGRVEVPLSKLKNLNRGREINFSLSRDGGKTFQGQIFLEVL
eukprot:gb/GEZN01002626.1/.p1 GENE.gb/GEZN01002626.1/~~gb/GEZN01002626.1/.p1  ORF type:complete len:720 (-),score=116.95 gb/GEZN01002626.1/:256-2352(-)